jgi:hypothetical protein
LAHLAHEEAGRPCLPLSLTRVWAPPAPLSSPSPFPSQLKPPRAPGGVSAATSSLSPPPCLSAARQAARDDRTRPTAPRQKPRTRDPSCARAVRAPTPGYPIAPFPNAHNSRPTRRAAGNQRDRARRTRRPAERPLCLRARRDPSAARTEPRALLREDPRPGDRDPAAERAQDPDRNVAPVRLYEPETGSRFSLSFPLMAMFVTVSLPCTIYSSASHSSTVRKLY